MNGAIKNNIEKMKRMPLSIPLTTAAAGTVATLFTSSKNLHAGMGVAWLLLSLWHGYQHSGKVQQDASVIQEKLASKATAITEKTTALKEKAVALKNRYNNSCEELGLEGFLASIEVSSFIPGRVRVYSTELMDNEKLCEQISSYLLSFTGVTSAVTNPVTGSILIKYLPDLLRTKPNLAKLEDYLAEHYGDK